MSKIALVIAHLPKPTGTTGEKSLLVVSVLFEILFLLYQCYYYETPHEMMCLTFRFESPLVGVSPLQDLSITRQTLVQGINLSTHCNDTSVVV